MTIAPNETPEGYARKIELMRFNWTAREWAFVAEMPNNITLIAVPAIVRNGKAARGTSWRAQCSEWDEKTRTMKRFGRDEYLNSQSDARSARRLAESIYLEAIA